MKSQTDFDAFYQTDLQPVLTELEARRLQIVRTLTFIGVAALVLLGAMALVLREALLQPAALIIVLAVLALGGGLVWKLVTGDFVAEFKRRVIGALVRFHDPSLRYDAAQHVAESQFRASGIFPDRIDRFRGEDCVAGRVGETAVEFSELHAEYKTETRDSKGHRRTQWHTIFKGLFFVADFNKDFKGETVVLPDVAQRLLGFLGQKLQEMNLRRGDLIKLEDPEFEKEFVVYGTDQIESRYILSTSLMRRILEYKRKTGKALHLSFANSNIYVAITTGRDMFEPRLFRSLVGAETLREYLDDLQMILGIVEDMNLNTRIWTK